MRKFPFMVPLAVAMACTSSFFPGVGPPPSACNPTVPLSSPCGFQSIHSNCFNGIISCASSGHVQRCPVSIAGAGNCSISLVVGDGTSHDLTVTSTLTPGGGSSCFTVTSVSGVTDFTSATCTIPVTLPDASNTCSYDVPIATSDKRCASTVDCSILQHTLDCSGSLDDVGVNLFSLGTLTQEEKLQDLLCKNAKCGPPLLPPRADDGTTGQGTPSVTCLGGSDGGGFCTTSFADAGGGADAGSD